MSLSWWPSVPCITSIMVFFVKLVTDLHRVQYLLWLAEEIELRGRSEQVLRKTQDSGQGGSGRWALFQTFQSAHKVEWALVMVLPLAVSPAPALAPEGRALQGLCPTSNHYLWVFIMLVIQPFSQFFKYICF